MLLTIVPLALVKRAVRPDESPNAMVLSILPITVVLCVHFGNVGTPAVVLTFRPVALVEAAIREAQGALAVRVA